MKRSIYCVSLLLLVFFPLRNLASEVYTNRSFKSSSGKWGIVDENLRIIIPAVYKNAGLFTGDVANVRIDDITWGFVNKDNKLLFSVKAKELYPLFDGWARYRDLNGMYGFVNEKGDFLFSGLTWAADFNEECAPVRKKKKGQCTYINTAGVTEFPGFESEISYSFDHGYAVTVKDGKRGVIDRKGTTVIKCMYKWIEYKGDKYWQVINPEEAASSYLINAAGIRIGKILIKQCSKIYDGAAFVNLPAESHENFRKYEIADDAVSSLYENWILENGNTCSTILAISRRGKDGIWHTYLEDRNGQPVCSLVFDEFLDEINGILRMQKGGKEYYVNSSGAVFLPE
ncbi:MAG TPA: hypothetical protein DCL73_12280 [Treponema sp.]|nr:hypothetical protein [Treponema sp.]